MPTPNRDHLYTTTYAIKKELKDPLRAAVEKMGVGSVGTLLSMVAERPDEVAQALAPIINSYMADKELVGRGKGKVTVAREVLQTTRDDEVAELLAELGVHNGPTP